MNTAPTPTDAVKSEQVNADAQASKRRPIDTHERMPRRLHLAAVGVNEWIERFWDEVIGANELSSRTKPVMQVNAFTHSKFPERILGTMTTNEIVEAQRRVAERTVDGFWADTEDVSFVYGDYEPRQDGQSWQWAKVVNGYDDWDDAFLSLLRYAIRSVTDLPYALYNSCITDSSSWRWGDSDEPERRAVHSATSYEHAGDDLIWQGLYPSNNPGGNAVLSSPTIRAGLDARVRTGYRIRRAAANKPVMPALFFRHFQDNRHYQAHCLSALNAVGADDVLVWVKLGERNADGSVNERNSQFMFGEYKRRWEESMPDLLAWLDREPLPTMREIGVGA